MITEATISSETPQDPRRIVESFLHSAVVLDDVLVMSESDKTARTPKAISDVTRPDYPVRVRNDHEADMSSHRGVPLNVDTVINAFADMGIVCAVLNPAPADDSVEGLGNPYPRRVIKAAIRADIVVLDWKIRDSDGEITLDVLQQILSDDSNNGRLRLVAIYTGESDLIDIADKVKSTINHFYKGSALDYERPFRMSKGPLRIVIFAKEGTIKGDGPNSGFSEVAEGQLASRLVEEFVLMTSGLLPNVALAGIGTIRNKAHSVIAKFSQDLDPAYLGHRLMLPHPPDAEDHLVEALASEILSVLEADRPGEHADIQAIEEWLKESHRIEWRDVLHYGLEQPVALPLKKGTQHQYRKKEVRRCGTGLFTNEQATRDRKFAALLSLKTRYSQRKPILSLGTILRRVGQGGSQYVLCLQPKCDSVRLSGASGFPMVSLQKVDAGKPCDIVLRGETDEWEDFKIIAKPSSLTVPRFEAGVNPPGVVLAKSGESGRFYFEDIDGGKYWWTAEMKDEHAFRIAGQVASALARPGPNDAEWLRRGSAP